MTTEQLLIVLAVVTVTLAVTAILRRRAVPTPVVLVVAGLVIGFLPFIPDVSLEPRVVLLGVLPLLVYEAGYNSSPRAFSRNAVPIALLAVGLVVLTAGVVAVAAHEVGHLPWALSFVLGTAVAPTDAVAATSVAARLGLPRELSSVLEGEALFNDATALVLYGSAVAAATSGHFSAAGTAARIGYGAVVGVAIGGAVAVAGRVVRQWLDDPPIEIAVSLLTAYLAYLPAEALGASGVLAAVTAGLYLGWHSSGSFSAGARLQSAAFWDNLVFLVNAALFVFVGMSFHTFTASAAGPSGGCCSPAWPSSAPWWSPASCGSRLRDACCDPCAGPGAGDGRNGSSSGGRACGGPSPRGALAIPTMAAHGRPLAGRDDVIYLAYAVIIVTLVGQGLTLPLVVRVLGLREEAHVAETERQARLDLATAAQAYLEELEAGGDLPAEVYETLNVQLTARIRRLEEAPQSGRRPNRGDGPNRRDRPSDRHWPRSGTYGSSCSTSSVSSSWRCAASAASGQGSSGPSSATSTSRRPGCADLAGRTARLRCARGSPRRRGAGCPGPRCRPPSRRGSEARALRRRPPGWAGAAERRWRC